MTDLNQVKKRMECCDLIKKNKISGKVTSRCSEDVLRENMDRLIRSGKCTEFSTFMADMQAEIMQKKESLEYVLDLMESGITAGRIGTLMEEVPVETLVEDYPEDDVRIVLLDERIESCCMGVYLKYYLHDDLDGEELQRLWLGIKWFRNNRKHLTDDWIGTIGEAREMMAEPAVANGCFAGNDADRYMEILAANKVFRRLLNEMYSSDCGCIGPDDNNVEEMEKMAGRLLTLWQWASGFFSKEELGCFLQRWMENKAMVYDLEFLKRKVDSGQAVDKKTFLASRASYISFFYNESFPEQTYGVREELVIYAITRKKKAFIRLLRENIDLYRKIPANSVLFSRLFYEKCINLNALNSRNLEACRQMLNGRKEILEMICGKGYTFDEVFLIYGLPQVYISFYGRLSALRSDDRIRIMREVIRKDCLDEGMDLEPIAEKLSHRLLSEWMRQDFGHICGMTGKYAAKLLSMYKELGHLIPGMHNNAEARYVVNHPERCSGCLSMEEVREDAVEYDNDWKYLSWEFGFSAEFCSENKGHIRDFIFSDGAHIFKTYYDRNQGKAEELRRLVSAELMGRFKELKYFRDDLMQEIDYPISEEQKQEWMRNTKASDGSLCLWEEDGLIPVMNTGILPYETCLSYRSGMHNQCLLACHDANKKVVYMSYNGTIVLRAAIRLTKGTFRENGGNTSGKPRLHFADLAACDMGLEADGEMTEEKEYLTLFLEKAYVEGIPGGMMKAAFLLLFGLMQKKAESMHALLVTSMSYQNSLSDKMIPVNYSIYISRSKAGGQYLDSMGGSKCVDREGSYERYRYLLEKEKISFMEEAG